MSQLPPGPSSPLIVGAWLLGIGLVVGLRGLELSDETTFLAEGRRILAGELPPLFRFPLTATLLALAERVVGTVCALPSCVPSLWGGRLLVAGCLVVSATGTAAFLREAQQPAAARWALALFPCFPSLVLLVGANASHWVTLALLPVVGWLTLRSCSAGSMATAAGLALVVALACLARPDGVGLTVLTGGSLAWLAERRARLRLVATYGLVLAVALGAVSLAYAGTAQEADWMYRERSYLAFEQGYGHIFPQRISGSPWFEGRQAAERAFGTAEDNGNSILRAAWRHPGAFAERLGAGFVLGARLLAVVLSVSLPLLGSVLAGVALSGSMRPPAVRAWPPETRRAVVVGGACLLTLAPYLLTFYRRDYFLHVLWVLIAAVAAAAAQVIDAGSARPLRRRVLGGFQGALVACVAIGVAASAFKVMEWREQGMPLAERLAVVKALAAGTEPGARVWAATPHLTRHANRAPARVEIATPDSCAQIERALAEHRPTYVLAEVRDRSTARSSIQEADLRQVAVLMERCGLGAAQAIELPGSIRDRWQLYRLVYR